MAEKENNKNNSQFRIDRVNKIKEMYADESSRKRRQDETPSYSTQNYTTAAAVRQALIDGINDKTAVVDASRRLYTTNPIYAAVINYLTDMFMFRYTVTPHKVYTKSKAKAKKTLDADSFQIMYNQMIEVADGLGIEAKFPMLLNTLFIQGSVYFTTVSDDESLTIETITLPEKYCKKVGESQYGTTVIQFDFSYFTNLGLSKVELDEFLKTWPKEFKTKYNKYLSDNSLRWQTMDPHFTTGILMNEIGIPTYFYLYGSILNYEKYEDNELQRNENLLKYIVVHTLPVYQDKLVFDMDEANAIHQSIRKRIEINNNARLITTFGDVKISKVTDTDTSENKALAQAFEAIFNNAGFNAGAFTGDSVTALKYALIRDKGMVWKYIQMLLSFYNLSVNNWFDFKGYQADLAILPISQYTYNDDMETIKNHATLGVGKLNYFVASGIKQKNIQDTLYLEEFLGLNKITPMQTSYTQTAEDRQDEGSNDDSSKNSENSKSEIEPSDKDDQNDNEENN